MSAVPFLVPNVPARLKATKPELAVDDTDGVAIRLRKRRRELGLMQAEAGRLMGVCKSTVWQWETGRVEPEDRLYPAIINFLGYEPWPEPRTLAERLRAERRRRGISITAAAELIGAAHSAFTNWENSEALPSRENRRKVEAFVGMGGLSA